MPQVSGHDGHDATDGTALGQIETFESFGCSVPIENPETLQRVTPDKAFVRKFFNGTLTMPDGEKVDIWSFEAEDRLSVPGKRFPAASIVVHEGDVVHNTLHASKNSHTIHHHGIEPTAFNDGAGHTSFEVTGSYTYQFRATECGTFFYHCHKNTTLHVEMGMYGGLSVVPRDHVRPDGRFNAFPLMVADVVPFDVFARTSFATRDDLRAYDVEAFWVTDEIDPVWHDFNHNAGLCGEDAGLNNFNPKYFLVSGVPFHQDGSRRAFVQDPADLAVVEVRAKVGQTVLVRFVHAGYEVLNVVIPPGLDVVVIEDTGRQLGGLRSPYSRPFALPVNINAPTVPLPITPARRNTVLVRLQKGQPAGRYVFELIFRHLVTGKALGSVFPAIVFA